MAIEEAQLNISDLEECINLDALSPEFVEYLTKKQRDAIPDEDYAWPDAPGGPKYPINSQAHLIAAATLIGRAPQAKQAAIKKRAITIAKRKGFTLPKSWQDDTKETTENVPSDPLLTPGFPTSPSSSPEKPRIAHMTVRWLYDDAISYNGGRQYPKETVDRLVQSAQLRLSNPDNPILCCYASHDDADNDESLKIVGRITAVWKEGTDALASIDIPDTHHGRDIVTLTSNKYLKTISLRASGGEIQIDKNKANPQVVGNGITLDGIDFTGFPGIPEARIQQVIVESSLQNNPSELFELFPQSILLASSEEKQPEEVLKQAREEKQPMEEKKLEEPAKVDEYISENVSLQPIREAEIIPPLTSGVTTGVTSDPTDDAYHKRMYPNAPSMTQGDGSVPMSAQLREAHHHIAAVQNRTCAPAGMESVYRAAGLTEAGKMISDKNAKHLDQAHDNIAHALGMECEGKMNKRPPMPNNANEDNMESRPLPASPVKEIHKMTPEEAAILLKEAGYKIEAPKTEAEKLQEAMQQQLDAQRKAMEESMATQRAAMEAQMAEIQKKMLQAQQQVQENPQRKSLVEGATTATPARPTIYHHGDYLKEQFKQMDFSRLADRSFPLPENTNIERLINEMKGPLLGMYEEKYGLGV